MLLYGGIGGVEWRRGALAALDGTKPKGLFCAGRQLGRTLRQFLRGAFMPWWKFESEKKYPWILPETESGWRSLLAFSIWIIMVGFLFTGVASSFYSIWALAWYSFGAAAVCYLGIVWLIQEPDPTETPDDPLDS